MKIIRMTTKDMVEEEIKNAKEIIKRYDNLFKTFLNLMEPIVSIKDVNGQEINLIVDRIQVVRGESSVERTKLQKIVKNVLATKEIGYTNNQKKELAKQNKITDKLVTNMGIDMQKLKEKISQINTERSK